MTARYARLAAIAIGAALSLPIAAQAGDWFQPPGSTEVGHATFPDGSTNYEFRMPDGSLRLVVIDKNGGLRRYFNPRAKKVRVNPNPPAGGNPYVATKGSPLCDRATGCGQANVGSGG